ncbi:two-component regulator propeller domain-containing protein [Rapidithrix thailandica]|uniref:histidine kinase n=1 Tax=Rapidithrix thailandica TaxID=413964 RepID=A0AAW9SJ29_9BACT
MAQFNPKVTFKFSHLSSKDGLPQNSILAIHQDRWGFLWFGTDDGLCRYDGYSFRVFRHNPEDPFSISSNVIRAIEEDAKGRLWIGTSGGGLNRYDPVTDRFTAYKYSSEKQTISHNKVFSLCVDRKGDIWVGTLGKGLNKVEIDEKEGDIQSIQQFYHQAEDSTSLSDNKVWSVYEDRQGQIWVATYDGGLNRYHPATGTFHQFNLPKVNGKEIHSVKTVFEDTQGAYWIGTEHYGLFRYLPQLQMFTHFAATGSPGGLSHQNVTGILEDKEGNLWVGTLGGGLNLFDRNTRQFITVRETPYDSYGLKGKSVYSLFEDRSGILWVGMYSGEGLNKLDPKVQQFQHHFPRVGQAESLKGSMVKSLFVDRAGTLWVGTFTGGLNRYDDKTQRFIHYQHQENNPYSLSHNSVQCIYEDRSRNLWIGTDGGGLNRFDRKTGRFESFQTISTFSEKVSNDEIWAILEDYRGNLWLGLANGGGVNRLNKATGEVKHYRYSASDTNSLSFDDVRVLYESTDHTLWIGTFGGGLSRFDEKNERFISYRNEPGNPQSLSNDVVTAIYEDHQGHLWVGTFGGGLNRFDPQSQAFQVYREQQGLPSDVIKAIREDAKGNLWISTVKGLSRFNPATEVFQNYTVNDGLQSDEFNLGSAFQDSSGQLYFGGTNGFNVFAPRDFETGNDSIDVVLTNLRVLNQSVVPGKAYNGTVILDKSIWASDHLTLSHENNVFLFEFAALAFSSPEKVKYAYQLVGEDKDWVVTDAKRRFAPYSNLSPGEYTFRLAAIDHRGNPISTVKNMSLTILPPWWRSYWAYLGYFVLFAGISFMAQQIIATRIRLRQDLKIAKLEKEKADELNQMKLTFFTNISHELRTPLTLILVPLEALLQNKELSTGIKQQLASIFRNAERLLRLINQLLDFRKQETNHLQLYVTESDILGFVEQAKQAFDLMATQRNIVYTLKSEVTSLKLWFDAEQMEKVLYNLISNAFKFTKDNGRITLRVCQPENTQEIYIEVEDNGKGIPEEDMEHIFDRFFQSERIEGKYFSGTGIGLALAKNLVEMHHGRIEVSSRPKEKTLFRICLPLGNAHFQAEELVHPELLPAQRSVHNLQSELAAVPEVFQKEMSDKKTEAHKPFTLLLVDDNPEVLAMLESNLRETYRVATALEGDTGLQMAKELKPDLVISDVMMPGMNGIEFCKQLKSGVETSHIPVILLTARGSMDFKLEGMESGADDYITKPFHLQLLTLKIKNMLRSRQKLREQFQRQVRIEPKEITVTSLDEALLSKALQVVEEHMDAAKLDVTFLGKELGLSRTLLFEKIKAITGQTPNEFIQSIRLKRAAQILSQSPVKISEVCYQVGFNQPKYFSKKFKQQFGVAPSEYANGKRAEED